MSIIRVKRTKDFSVLPNDLLRDKTLSHKARGVLCYLLSRPEDWEVRRDDLRTDKDGEAAIRSALKELRAAGYIVWQPIRENGRIIRWEHWVYDWPILDVENLHLVNGHVENDPLTKNREELNTELTKKDSNANALLRRAVKQPTALRWPDDDLWLLTFLQTQEVLTLVTLPLEHKWWDSVSIACSGVSEQFLKVEFAKIESWLIENPSRKPTPKGAKRFIRTWLERAHERERRFRNGKT